MTKIVKPKPVADLPSLRKVYNHPRVLTDFDDRRTRGEESKNADEWWKPIYGGDQPDKLELSGKMLILFAILTDCEARDEKLLVFSGCLSTLNVIEHFLGTIRDQTGNSDVSSSKFKGTWIRNVDYLRLDGTKNVERRKIDIATFNNKTNRRTRCRSIFGLFSVDH